MHSFRRAALFSIALVLLPLAGIADEATTNAAPVPDAITNSAPTPATNAAPIPMRPVDFPALLLKAKAGDPVAQLDVSMDYFNGKGVEQDYHEAFKWSLESAIQGDGIGEENVGSFYNQGRGVHANQVKAYEWYLKAAQHGRSGAQRAIGVRFLSGMGSPRNIEEAASWLRKAAIEGEPEAQSRIGYSLTFGNYAVKDPEKGFTYLMASAGPFPYSRFLVARCYNEGIFVARDTVRAYAWALIAPKQKETQDFLDSLAIKMPVDQLEQATTLSEQLLKQVENQNMQDSAMTATLDQGTSITIKYERCLDYIVVPLTLQDKEQFNFLIDTGCSVSALDARVAARVGLTGPNYFPMTGIGKDIALSTLVEDAHITGFGLNIRGARLATLPLFNLDEYIGRPLAGIIGYDILKRFVVHIDYDKHTLTLALPGKFVEDPKAKSVPIVVGENSAFVAATIIDDGGTNAKGAFLIDTGDDGCVSLTKVFQDANPKLSVPTVTELSSIGLGGTEPARFGKATAALGDFKLEHAIVDLMQARQGTWVNLNGGIIGEGLWRRFNLTLDFPGQKLFLQRGAHFSRPFDFHFSGLAIKTTGGDYKTFVAYQVVADSPAEKVGLQVGDQIVQIDQHPTNAMTIDDVYDYMEREGVHEILYRRDGKDTALHLPVCDPFKHPEQLALYKKVPPIVPAGSKIESLSVEYMNGAPPLYPDEVIFRAAGLKVGDDFLPYNSNRALKKLYATGLFSNAGLRPESTPTGVKVKILLEVNPVVQSIVFTGLTPDEETHVRPLMRAQEGVRTSAYDLACDADLVRETFGKDNPTDRTVTIDVTGNDGTKLHQDIVVPKSGAGT